MIFESSLDELVEEIWGNEPVYISLGEIIGKWLER